MESPPISSIHNHSVSSLSESGTRFSDLKEEGKQLESALEALSEIQSQAQDFIRKVNDRDFGSRERLLDLLEPFLLTIGPVQQIKPMTEFTIPLTIKNRSFRTLEAALLVKSGKYGYQEVLDIGKLRPDEETTLLYSVQTEEELIFQVVAQPPGTVFKLLENPEFAVSATIQRPRITYPHGTDFSREKIFVKLHRTNLQISEIVLKNEVLGYVKTVRFPGENNDVFVFLQMDPVARTVGGYKEVWTVKAGERQVGKDIVIEYTIEDPIDGEERKQSG